MSEKPNRPSGGGKHQRSWKNYLIDKDYQLRNTIISVVIAAIVCTALGTLVIWQTRQANAEFKKQSNDATALYQRQRADTTKLFGDTRDAATKDVKKLLNVATEMLKVQKQDKDPDMRQLAAVAMADLKKDDERIVKRRRDEDKRLADQRIKEDNERVEQRKKQDREAAAKRSRRELILIIAIIAFGVVFLVVIFICNIVITHRTAGPLFKMGRYMDEVRDGKYTEVWNLRKGDQLVEFYGRFQAMHKAIKARVERDVELMAAAVAACEKAGVEGEAVDELKARLAEKREAVGADAD
jgi:nitrogen fixation/metabolism regulation signal transduction histidine kinase